MEKEEVSKKDDNNSRETQVVMRDVLDKLTMDTPLNKYDIVMLARRWAYELKSKQGESRSIQELIAVAVHDILSSKVSTKMVRELPHLNTKKLKAMTPADVLQALEAVGKTEEKEKEKKEEKGKKEKKTSKKIT